MCGLDRYRTVESKPYAYIGYINDNRVRHVIPAIQPDKCTHVDARAGPVRAWLRSDRRCRMTVVRTSAQ
jgi:hypothetical protein